MTRCIVVIISIGGIMLGACSSPHRVSAPLIDLVPGDALPTIPGIGLASGYGGNVDSTLIFAGGTNFPDAPPWRNGKKVWHDSIYRLSPDAAIWQRIGKLPKPLAGGASVTTSAGLLCIGGTDDVKTLADVWLVRAKGDGISVERYPSLPEPVTACGAAIAGGRVYVVAGHTTHTPLLADASAAVWSLDLDDLSSGWRAEPPLPGPGRWAPVVASVDDRLIVLSGMFRKPPEAPGGSYGIGFLQDVYAFSTSTKSWKRLKDLPRSVAAAPSPAPVVDGQIVLLGGGVEAADIVKPMDARTPLDAKIRTYSVATGETTVLGTTISPSVVVAPVVIWRGQFVVISGEVQAGVRTENVQSFRIEKRHQPGQ